MLDIDEKIFKAYMIVTMWLKIGAGIAALNLIMLVVNFANINKLL